MADAVISTRAADGTDLSFASCSRAANSPSLVCLYAPVNIAGDGSDWTVKGSKQHTDDSV